MKKLKECPFCGENNITLYQKKPHNWVVECNLCRCELNNFISEKIAVEDWNTRAYPLLEEAIEEIKKRLIPSATTFIHRSGFLLGIDVGLSLALSDIYEHIPEVKK